jgi:UDP-GlcNAc:undecaprenyl-phosphate/decaprenyl-phosphate GlcNAc-1-phosphate transferase
VIPYLLTGVVALGVTFALTPLVSRFSVRIGAIDHPSDRKVHANPTPTLGGLAIFIGLAVAGGAALFIPDFEPAFTQSSQLLGVIAGSVVIVALGVVDDLKDLPAPVKLSGQVFAAGILFLAGVKWVIVPLPNGVSYVLSDDVSVLVTVMWLVAMMNAVNLVDGLDGLAAGIVSIAASAFFVYSLQLTEAGEFPGGIAGPLLAIIIVGVSLGFLRHNFFPARIFMGDSGSMLLGLVLGAATVLGIGRGPYSPNFDSTAQAEVFLAYFPLLIPLAVILIPFADTVLAVVRRWRKRKSVFHADKEHLHHRLMDLGHGHKQAVIVMYVWSALAAGAGLAFTFLDPDDFIFALPVAVGAIVIYTLFPILTKAIQDRL